MRGFILAAGLGTRLKPWTDSHPKALFPVDGVPMLQRVIEKMHGAGIEDITVNVFHFADQIIDFVKAKGWKIKFSDERPVLLETGGAILHASPFLFDGEDSEPVLVHNADILSNADFTLIGNAHLASGADATLLVSDRDSSRKLIFSPDMKLEGWHSLATGEFKPAMLDSGHISPDSVELAFSGIYVISRAFVERMKSSGWKGKFPVMDFILSTLDAGDYRGYSQPDLKLTDIGKSVP